MHKIYSLFIILIVINLPLSAKSKSEYKFNHYTQRIDNKGLVRSLFPNRFLHQQLYELTYLTPEYRGYNSLNSNRLIDDVKTKYKNKYNDDPEKLEKKLNRRVLAPFLNPEWDNFSDNEIAIAAVCQSPQT